MHFTVMKAHEGKRENELLGVGVEAGCSIFSFETEAFHYHACIRCLYYHMSMNAYKYMCLMCVPVHVCVYLYVC